MNRIRVALLGFAAMGVIVGCSSSGDQTTAGGTTTASTPPPPPAPTGTPTGTDGATLFAQTCAGCHGDKGAGGRRAPKLAGSHTAVADATKIITNGKGKMPPFGTRLQKDQIDAIATYVSTL